MSGGPSVSDIARLLQFGDSMFPVGAFSFSNGVEAAVQAGVVHDKESLHEFVSTAIELATAGDGIAVIQAHRGTRSGDASRVGDADRAVQLRKLNEEMRLMAVRMGRKLAEAGMYLGCGPGISDWLAKIRDGSLPGTYPVGLGVLFADLGLSESDAFAAHHYGVAMMMLSSAQRLMRLHHLDAQAILLAVTGRTQDDYQRASRRGLSEMAAFAPVTDVLAASHLRAHVRMFMN